MSSRTTRAWRNYKRIYEMEEKRNTPPQSEEVDFAFAYAYKVTGESLEYRHDFEDSNPWN